jgi:hypothetical protein
MTKTTESNSIIPTSSVFQVEKTKNRVGNNCNPTPTKLPAIIAKTKAVTSAKVTSMLVEKNSSKKRAANKQNTTSKHKRKKIDGTSMLDMEATLIENTSQFLFFFVVSLTPLQKLHEVLKDSHVSPDNPHLSEIVHYVDEEEKCYGISYKEFLRHCDNGMDAWAVK